MDRRRATVVALFVLLAALGLVLYMSIGKSRLFTIKPPVTQEEAREELQKGVSATTITSLTTVSTEAVLDKPRYTGQDADGNGWELTGNKATQQGTAVSGTYVLDGVSARWMGVSATAPLTLHAERGVYHPVEDVLKLQGAVEAHGEGVTLRTEAVDMDLKTRVLEGNGASGVDMEGTWGRWDVQVHGARLQVDGLARTARLYGGVKAVLTPVGQGKGAR